MCIEFTTYKIVLMLLPPVMSLEQLPGQSMPVDYAFHGGMRMMQERGFTHWPELIKSL